MTALLWICALQLGAVLCFFQGSDPMQEDGRPRSRSAQGNGFIQERGVVAGTRVGVVIVIPVFLAALVAVFLVVLVLFLGAILVAVLCLDKSWILAWSFGFLFCCCFGWRFRCSLGSCFGLCFCVVGGLGPGLVLAWSFQFLLVTILVVIFCI